MTVYQVWQTDPMGFARNQAAMVSGCALIDAQTEKLEAEKVRFDAEVSAVEEKLRALRQYSAALAAKTEALSMLKSHLRSNVYDVQISERISDFCKAGGVAVTDPSAHEGNLSRFIGPLQTFDKCAALSALSLSPVEVGSQSGRNSTELSEQPAGLMLINLAAEVLTSSKYPGISPLSNACYISDSQLFVCGPSNNAFLVSSAEGCVALPCMREPRKYHGVVPYRNSVYVFGGFSPSDKELKTWECFHLARREWTRSGKMMHRRFFNPTVIRDRIYLAGGFADKNVQEFNPETEEFAVIPCVNPIRICGVAMNAGGKLAVLTNKGMVQITVGENDSKETSMASDFPGLNMYSLVAPVPDGAGSLFILVSRGKEYLKLRISFTPQPMVTILS